MVRRGCSPRYANRDKRNAECRRRHREQRASQISSFSEAQLHHRFLTWITTEQGDIYPDMVKFFLDEKQVTERANPSAAGSLSLSGPAVRFPNTAEAEDQPVFTQPTAETATQQSRGPRVALPAVPLTPEDSARQKVLAEYLVEQLIRYQDCGHSQEEPGSIPEDQAGPLSPSAVPTVRLSEVVQEKYLDILSRDSIAAYSLEWNKYFPVDRRRRLFNGVETVYARDGGPGELQRVQPERTPPPRLDLERDSDTAGQRFQIHFDIDSAGGFASSLAVTRQGLYWIEVRPPVSNLTDSLHLDNVPVQFQNRDSGQWRQDRRLVHRIPHLPLGRVCGFESVEIYILFPRLYHPTRKSFVIIKNKYTLWMNKMFLPALYTTYSESILQNLPVSAVDAQTRVTAASAEQPMKHDKQPRVQLLQYRLRPELLNSLWQRVWARINGQGLAQFQGMKLLLTLDMDFLTDNFYNIGREAILPQGRPAREEPDPPAIFLLWRQCCLERFSHWLKKIAVAAESGTLSTALDPIEVTAGPSQRPQGPPVSDHDSDGDVEYTLETVNREGTETVNKESRPAKIKHRWRQEIYPFSLTRAMATLTIKPTWRSGLRKLDYLYSQHYNSRKALFAAGNHYVFSNPALNTLALDKGLIWAWQHIGRAVSHSPITLLRAYRYTKRRCQVALADSNHRAYGVREEYRVSKRLLQAVNRRMWAQGLAGQKLRVPQASIDPSTDPAPPHLPFFYHQTDLILHWLRWNINKFCLGFKMVYSLRPRTMIQWKHTRVMMMFLHCLLFTYGGQGTHPRRCNRLWLNQHIRPAANGSEQKRIDEGLDIKQTLERYSYAHYRAVFSTHSNFLLFHDVFTRMYNLREDHPRLALLLQLLDVFAVLAEQKAALIFQHKSAKIHYIEMLFAWLDRSFWSRATRTPGKNRFQTWLSVYPGLVKYYQTTEPTDPADVLYLPVSGWQHSQGPMPLNITLPPIPTNLNVYLATVADPARPDTNLNIPLPAIGVLNRPIQQYILDHTPEKRILRSYQREEITAISSVHSDSKWLIAHLENQVQILQDVYLQRQRDLSILFWRYIDSKSPLYLFTAPAKILEKDLDSKNIRNKRTRAEKKHFNPAETVHKRANQIQKKLAVISKRVIEKPVEL
ncbi:hypothetical protein BDV34DRAFT_233273 [Aspergillus parasiticus]|uniref:Uncharacterized protein n=1 Tax=Aspergillus parasiticus TaxID=5067 RepID=A0A5N6D2H1_ASPPA|nr:hypothetical protein BDV34DRAFT_233273 [Aspergillus parasiticus]